MLQTFNIYCDESCHLEHDGIDVMVLGAVWCPADEAARIAREIRDVKRRHGMAPGYEIKWTKVSASRLSLFLDLIDYFFDEPDLHFRAVVIAPKSGLSHAAFDQDHDTWYFKMYFDLLKVLIKSGNAYRIFLDIKDTRSALRVRKLHEVLCNNALDFEHELIRDIQTVGSHEVQQIQLVDLVSGALGYANRGLQTSNAKLQVVERLRSRSGLTLQHTTSLGQEKVNLLRWAPRGA